MLVRQHHPDCHRLDLQVEARHLQAVANPVFLVIGDGHGQRAGSQRTAHRGFVVSGTLPVPGFGQTHGSKGVHRAKTVVVADMHAAAIPASAAIFLPVSLPGTPRRQCQDVLNIAIAEMRIRLQHQGHRPRHNGGGKAGPSHRVQLRPRNRAIVELHPALGRHDAHARRTDQHIGPGVGKALAICPQDGQVAGRIKRRHDDVRPAVGHVGVIGIAAAGPAIAGRHHVRRSQPAPAIADRGQVIAEYPVHLRGEIRQAEWLPQRPAMVDHIVSSHARQ